MGKEKEREQLKVLSFYRISEADIPILVLPHLCCNPFAAVCAYWLQYLSVGQSQHLNNVIDATYFSSSVPKQCTHLLCAPQRGN